MFQATLAVSYTYGAAVEASNSAVASEPTTKQTSAEGDAKTAAVDDAAIRAKKRLVVFYLVILSQ